MKHYSLIVMLVFFFGIPCLYGKDIPYGIGTWPEDSLGNHRAVLQVDGGAEAVWAHIEWRRRDFNPEKKNIVIVDAKTGKRVSNAYPVTVTREYGDIVFQPVTAPGRYYVYYLPTQMSGWKYMPDVQYQEPDYSDGNEWLKNIEQSVNNLRAEGFRNLPEARVMEFQAIDEFHSFIRWR